MIAKRTGAFVCLTAFGALAALQKRKDNMRYGRFRKNGYCIGSGHVEAAVRAS